MFWQILHLHLVPCIFRKSTRAREEEEHVENMMERERRLDKEMNPMVIRQTSLLRACSSKYGGAVAWLGLIAEIIETGPTS
jgi:hypothetical protein